MRKESLGFSLIELSIVMVIVGLLIGSMISGFATYRQNSLIQQAQDDLKLINDALIGFAIQNGRLPCPDINGPGVPNDGQEDTIVVGLFNDCAQRAGYLPFRDLGLARARRDPWGGPYVYTVDWDFADDNPATPAATPACPIPSDGITSFGICAPGDIQIKDIGLQPGCPAPCRDIADNVAAVFFSLGQVTFTGLSVHEQENIPSWFPPNPPEDPDDPPVAWPGNDQIFVSRGFSNNNGANHFDDQIMWLPSSILINRMVQAGRLP